MAKRIFLSPSNQTENTYAYGGTNEASQCGRMGDAAKAALERCGFEVKMNKLGTLAQKVSESNGWNADLHIAIHTNAYNKTVTGTRMFYYSEGGGSYKACKAIYDVLAPITPGDSENIKAYPGLYEMKNTTASSVYIEVDFHDVAEIAKWLMEHPVEIGEAICRGVCNYYGTTYIAPGELPKPDTTPAPAPEETENFAAGKTYKNGSTREPIYADTGLTQRIGSLNPGETCVCLAVVNGRYLVYYPVDGTEEYKAGFAEYHGGV